MGQVTSLMLIPLTVLLLYLCHKIRRIHLKTYQIITHIDRRLDNTYRQLQAFSAIESTLHLSRFLPPLRGWAASPDFLLIVMNHALDKKPTVVLECGSGASTLVLAKCAQTNACGKVYSLEHDPKIAKRTRDMLERASLSDWGTVIDAPIIRHEIGGEVWRWYSLADLPKRGIDLLVIDGPPMPLGPMIRYPAGPLLFTRVNEGGTVFLDDSDRNDERAILKRWSSEYKSLQVEDLNCERGCVALHLQYEKI